MVVSSIFMHLKNSEVNSPSDINSSIPVSLHDMDKHIKLTTKLADKN